MLGKSFYNERVCYVTLILTGVASAGVGWCAPAVQGRDPERVRVAPLLPAISGRLASGGHASRRAIWVGDATFCCGEKAHMTVGSAASLRRLVTRSDSHPALVVPESGAVLSYAGLQRALDRAAGRLAALGVREGDRVAIAAANGPALVVSFLAVVASDAVAAPLNPALGAAELAAELSDLRVSRLLHD